MTKAPTQIHTAIPRLAYSICTLVTDMNEYLSMIDSLKRLGFSDFDCEYLFIDNSTCNRFDAFSGYSRFLSEAAGRYIILCHQDISPIEDNRSKLDLLLSELTSLDKYWGLCGNAGASASGDLVFKISHPDKFFDLGGPFPRQVVSLDENFIVVRRDANLAISRNLTGFHWYGSDLCIIADILGWNAYVIDFHIEHKSTGSVNNDFRRISVDLRKKYAYAFRSRWQRVSTSQDVYISSSIWKSFLIRAFNYFYVRTILAVRNRK